MRCCVNDFLCYLTICFSLCSLCVPIWQFLRKENLFATSVIVYGCSFLKWQKFLWTWMKKSQRKVQIFVLRFQKWVIHWLPFQSSICSRLWEVILKKSQKKGSCLEKSVNSLLKKSLNLSKLFEPTLNMKINVHVFVKACLFMVHFTKIVMSLPCQQLTTEQCKEVSRMVQLHCNRKLTKVLFQSSPDRCLF